MKKITVFCLCLLFAVFLFFEIKTIELNQRFPKQNYIAHAGGMIDGHTYTNSKEAVLQSIRNGIKYIELDLQLTSDGKLVAVHDWKDFRKMTHNSDSCSDCPLDYETFRKSLIYGKYHPLTCDDINSIFVKYPDVYLVTDKFSDPYILDHNLNRIKNRMFVECFTEKDYDNCKEHGFGVPMISSALGLRNLWNFDCYTMPLDNYKSSRGLSRTLNISALAISNIKNITNSNDADSLFSIDKRIKFVYIDSLINKRNGNKK